MVLKATKFLSSNEHTNKREECAECLRLISLVALLNDNLTIGFNELCKKSQEGSQLMLTYNQLSVASGYYFYAAYLKTKLQTGSQFKKSASLVTAKTVI
jgi:hypothetical protein